MEYRDETVEQEDFYQKYLDDLQEIVLCTEPEREILLSKAARGDESAKKRLVEGHLKMVLELAADYMDGALSPGDVIQEANMALLAAVDGYREGDFLQSMKERIRNSLEKALEDQRREQTAGEEAAARANVLQEVSRVMAEELEREATVEELAERMKMTPEEIRDIMKMTMDAVAVVSRDVK